MKITSVRIVTAVIGITLASSSYSQNVPISIQLTPSPSSKAQIPNFQAFITGDGVELMGSYSGTAGTTAGFHYSVDLQSRTYTATPFTEAEILEEISRIEPEISDRMMASVNEASRLKPQSGTATLLAGGGECTLWEGVATLLVQVTTDDLPGIDLAKTTLATIWNTSGCEIMLVDRFGATWAANPSELGTHWFVDSSSVTSSPYFWQSPPIVATHSAWFHNWDFLNPNVQTQAHHYISFVAQDAVDYDVNWYAHHFGEWNWALDGDVFINYTLN